MALRFGNSGVRFGAGRPARLGGTPPARAGLGKLLLGVPGTFLCGFPKGREAAMAKAEQRAENLESGKNFEQSHLTNHIPVVRKTPFAYSAFFVVTTNQTIGRSFPNPLGCMTLFRPARKPHRLTRPRRP